MRRRIAGRLFAVAVALLAPWAAAEPTNTAASAKATLGDLDSLRIRRLGAMAIREAYPTLSTRGLKHGHVLFLEHSGNPARTRILATWLGRDALDRQPGATPDQDRVQVLKVEVWMTLQGEIVRVTNTTTWVQRVVSPGASPEASP